MQSDHELFIGGISRNTNEVRLRQYFSGYGNVVEAKIIKDRDTGRSRGFGFVLFSDRDVAERVAGHKYNIDGTMVEAKKALLTDDTTTINNWLEKSDCQRRKLFVGGLPPTVTETDLRKYFEQFGKVTYAVVRYDDVTNISRGFGFITYESKDSVDHALSKHSHQINGYMIRVTTASRKQVAPGPTRTTLGGNPYGLNSTNRIHNQGHNDRMYGRSGGPISGNETRLNYGSNDLQYGRGLNPYYGNSSRFGNRVNLDGGNWNDNSRFSSNRGNLSANRGFGPIGSPVLPREGGNGLGGGPYGRNNTGRGRGRGYDATFSDVYSRDGPRDRTRGLDREGSGSGGLDGATRSFPSYVGGYSGTYRQ